MGGYWFKVHGGRYQQAGLPDLMGIVDGHFFGLEVKIPQRKNTLTALQKETIREIRRAGGTAYVVTSPEEAEAAVRKFFGLVSSQERGSRELPKQ